ncbi:MAG TPA: YafY family protein [Mycobacteriales bacterium]|nr:YafY family protein [Mycobacteriales bacterium]
MANTSSRMLRLLSLLQTHRYWPGAELAGRLEVSVRTLRRDVDRLRELGYPVRASRGVDGGYQLAVGAALPPLVLDDEEAVALTVGLLASSRSAVAGMAEASVRALAKVVPVLPTRLRRRVDALRAMTEPLGFGGGGNIDPGDLTMVALACRDTERIRFTYTARGGAPSERHVEPHRLVPMGQRWYLVGYDLTRHDWRSFRLDRLTGPHGTGAHFAPRILPAKDAADFVRAGLQTSSHRVAVILHAPAGRIREKLGRWATIEDIDAGSCRLRMTADSLDWPVFALGAAGVDFTVESPPELAELVQEWGSRFSRARATAR